MNDFLTHSLRQLANGSTLSFDERNDYRLWSALSGWLKEHNVKFSIKATGGGYYVTYHYRVDGRCLGRLNKIIDNE